MFLTGKALDLGITLDAVRAGLAERLTLGQLLTRRTVISVFMKHRTPTCDRQLAALVRIWPELERGGCNLVAISRDRLSVQKRAAAALPVPFVLVADPEDRFARGAGTLIEKNMYGRKYLGPARVVLVVDPDGTVQDAETVEAADHGAQVLRLVAALRKQ